jgi:hypothetical protein
MATVDCAVRESVWIDDAIRIHVTGHRDGDLYLFVEAPASFEFSGAHQFHGQFPYEGDGMGHTLVVREGTSFSIGAIAVRIEAVGLRVSGARVLRDVRLRIGGPTTMPITREAARRLKYPSRPLCSY